MALSYLAKEGRLFIVDAMTSEGKTSELQSRLEAFGLSKAVMIDGKTNDMMKRASRNLPTYKFYSVDGLNVFDLLKYDAAIISKDSVAKIVDRCQAE
jgi:large subunit ribosomal protein L4